MLLSLFRFCFRHIQTYSSIIPEHTHAYSEPCVSLTYFYHKAYSDYKVYHNTILNIFAKAPFWWFDTVLNAPLS